jgi:hypothetical protein
MKTLFFALLFLAQPLPAQTLLALSGSKTITLSNAAGESRVIGKVEFTPQGSATVFKVSIDPELFGEYFLAMRPFKCLTGGAQHLCHFPLTKVGNAITASDWQPLEYALMFIHKKPAALSLDSRNGLYYQLERTERGFKGRVFDVDMEPIIVPDSVPTSQRERPIRAVDLHKADLSAYWLPLITID